MPYAYFRRNILSALNLLVIQHYLVTFVFVATSVVLPVVARVVLPVVARVVLPAAARVVLPAVA